MVCKEGPPEGTAMKNTEKYLSNIRIKLNEAHVLGESFTPIIKDIISDKQLADQEAAANVIRSMGGDNASIEALILKINEAMQKAEVKS